MPNICKYKDCEKRRSYALAGKSARYCKTHKECGMIDVTHKTCSKKDCIKRSCYGNPGQKAEYCKKHKKDGMFDITNKRCLKKDCGKQPFYGNPGQQAEYCVDHKKYNMIDVRSKKCNKKDCEKQPIFALPGQKAEYCGDHKGDGMIDVKNKRCKNDHCDTLANRKYKGYCAYCFKNLFPDDPLSRNHKTKEKDVVKAIKEEFDEQHDITTDKTVGGCSKRRPDILIELYLKKHNIIVEIDEDAHKGYDTTCEEKRICEIYQDFAYKKLVVIRFNPDSYVNEEGKRIKSPWTFSKTGVLSISNKKEWTSRLDALKEKIHHWIKTKPTKAITLDYLFFDEE